MLDIQLLRDEVLLKLIHPERMTASKLLWIPEHAQRTPSEACRGVVVATGPGHRAKYGARVPCDVRVGDVVQFYWHAGKATSGHWPDEDHRIIPESQIQVIVESAA